MATQNLRIKNGLSVGDIVIDATNNTIIGLSTSAPSADGDVVTKAYADSGSQVMTNKTLTSPVLDGSLSGTAFLDEDDMNSNSATAVASQQSIKAYVDNGLSSLSSTSISDGNSSVVVADTGTGTITVTADGGSVATFAAAATTITASGAINLTAGTDVVIPANVGITFGSGEKIEGDNTNLTITSGNDIALNAVGDVTVANNMIITGNLNVQGTETIFNTQDLTVEDSIISTNANISSSANMPRFSGLHIHRGSGSTLTELDPYMLWDDQYDVSGGSGLGGTFTFLGSVHNEGSETPNTDFTLADLRCNIIEATATAAQYADIAERFAADAPITPGAVVMLGGSAEITETEEELSDRVFGVISTQPAYMMNNKAGNNDTHPFVAMTGRTPVRVTGTVNKGDRLVSSSIRGTARAASAGETINPFHVIGRALEDKFDNGIGLVNCVVRTNN